MTNHEFWIVAVPSTGTSGELCDEFQLQIGPDSSNKLVDLVVPFRVPGFKIDSLDTLISQSETLEKQDATCRNAVSKITEVLHAAFVDSTESMEAYLTVQNKAPQEYVTSFEWNTGRFSPSRGITALAAGITNETELLENDVRAKFSAYQQASKALQSIERKQSGNLSQKSLADIVQEEDVVQDSDYLTNVFLAVPKNLVNEFESSYETMTNLVVPRSAKVLAGDEEFVLYTVVVFKKTSEEFENKAREKHYIVRDFSFRSGMKEEEQRDLENASVEEKRSWTSLVRYAAVAYSDAFQAWMHLKCLRVFVESVLRYGLPPDFSAVLLMPRAKSASKLKNLLSKKYSYLAQTPTSKPQAKELEEKLADVSLDEEYLPFVFYSVSF
ncbi:V-type ATPase V1 subunit C [Schizosaccharomyces japonicus yFS275]|uniref:V-type proton ATPase subunit C n=1 Tax=Schizosaccharomyces japonicus (strain yFS275 / FY16936) TaxID=402676 RepID=B6JXT5_SCHJY|nr:V-type ATPase V1 subunit C [Schizosaccharomyces japonicus yFS275]EEB06353.1 V-type ATPase V1 subunit C [Schizosaccharomyces japonicus yFS275]